MSDLTEFLSARIAEDEAVARAATQSAKWWDWPLGIEGKRGGTVRAHEDPYIAMNLADGDATHIARHDPARVLAECEAKRQIVSTMQSAIDGGWQSQSREEIEFVATRVLRALASIYTDHPDYRLEWLL